MQYLVKFLQFLAFLAVFGILFNASLHLSFHEFFQTFRRYTLLARAFISSFIVIPLFTLGLCLAMKLPLAASIGMLLLSFSPYAPTVPKLAQSTDADVGLSVSLTALFSVLAIVLFPVLCQNLLFVLPDSYPIAVDTTGIGMKLAQSILLPILLGMFIAEFKPELAQRLAKPVEKFSNITLPLLLLIALVARFESLRIVNGQTILAMVLAALAFSALGYNFSENEESIRRATAFGSQLRNPGIAIYVATENFADLHVAPFISVFFIIMFLVAKLRGKFWSQPTALASKPA